MVVCLLGTLLTVLIAGLVATEGTTATRAERAIDRGTAFLLARQSAGGGFAEPGEAPDPSLTAWAVLGLRSAAPDDPAVGTALAAARRFLLASEPRTLTDLELRVIALEAVGASSSRLVAELRGAVRPNGQIGGALNSTFWGVLALASAGDPLPPRTARYIRSQQHRSGGFSWFPGGPPDTNDTAAAIQALVAAGTSPSARAVRRAIAYLRKQQKPNGGFPLDSTRPADAQSTAWVLQAFRAAGRKPPARAMRYLLRQQNRAGRVRYRAGRAISPVWVTAQALPGFAQVPFPLDSTGPP